MAGSKWKQLQHASPHQTAFFRLVNERCSASRSFAASWAPLCACAVSPSRYRVAPRRLAAAAQPYQAACLLFGTRAFSICDGAACCTWRRFWRRPPMDHNVIELTMAR